MKSYLRYYPRRTVRISIEHVRQRGQAAVQRAEYDRIIILRYGKPYRVLLRYEYFARLAKLAGGPVPVRQRNLSGRMRKSRSIRKH